MSANAVGAVIVAAVLGLIGLGAGITLQREHTMDVRCEQALGPGASFAGWGQCYPPRVTVEGVGQ